MSAPSSPWLNIIGVGEQGFGVLPPEVLELAHRAQAIFGPSRFRKEIERDYGKKYHPWQAPFSAMVEQVVARRGSPTLVLASGDPNWFGIGASLVKFIGRDEFAVRPHLSSFQLAAARLHWPLQHVETISLHARPAENLHPHIQPRARILALTSDRTTLAQVCNILTRRGFSGSRLWVLENLGARNEKISALSVAEKNIPEIGDFYVLAIECVADDNAQILPRTPGLPDEVFEHDGQITKRQVRAVTLCALAPVPGALLWDVGAGSGSIGIEWMRAAPGARAICFEKDPGRCQTIARNGSNLGVPALEVVAGDARDNLGGRPAPDAIFLGGNVADEVLFSALWQALKPGGRLVANVVTLSARAALFARQQRLGGSLCELGVSTLRTIGSATTLAPALPVTQWSVQKPFSGRKAEG